METFDGFSQAEARAFAQRWLPAWTGNDPDRLLACYTMRDGLIARNEVFFDPRALDG